MAQPTEVKTEPEAEGSASPTPMDEDLYEDAGDLEMYGKAPGNPFETIYLARVPRYMWEAWIKLTEKLGDDDEVQLGTLRTWNQPVEGIGKDGQPQQETKLRMLLHANFPEHQGIPREYNLDILDQNVVNHFIFSEEDLPGFKARSKARAEAARAGMPASLLRQRNENQERRTYDRRSRYQPYYRKAVPKKTKMIGKIHYDVRVEPRDAREEERLLAQRIFDVERSQSGLHVINRNQASSIIHGGTGAAADWGGNFIKNTATATKPKKGEVLKATRIPKNQLLDLIFDCFRQYQYWSMKALRQRTQQPDSYLRSVLEEVAVLVKTGPFANTYTLGEAYRDRAGNGSKEEAAAPADDEDDEGEEMEDVLPAA